MCTSGFVRLRGSSGAVLGLVLGWFACGTVPAAAQAHVDAPRPTTQPVDPDAPRVKVEPTTFDFGEVWEGAPARQEFKVTNVGHQPLTLAVKTSCGCTPATRPKSPLAPGESCTFTVEYTTTYVGPAQKVATLHSNDPVTPTITIPVRGLVKPVFTLNPARRMLFKGLELTSEETEVMKLRNDYPQPVTLELKDGQEFKWFDVELKELKRGVEYDLRVTTRPPLRMGVNTGTIILKTSLSDLPTIMIRVMANATPRVHVQPAMLYVSPDGKPESYLTLDVIHRRNHPLEVQDVRTSIRGMRWQFGNEIEPPPGAITRTIRLLVTIPGYDSVPPEGTELEILTNSEDPEFAVVKVPLLRAEPTPGVRRTPPQGPPKPHPDPVPPRPAPKAPAE